MIKKTDYYFNEKYWSHKSRRRLLNRYQQRIKSAQLALKYFGKMSREEREEYNRNKRLLKRIKNIGVK
jgi:CRISPR/Cas system-associated protein Cas5 (RAMP superfamily)